jgi:hypothetical protein
MILKSSKKPKGYEGCFAEKEKTLSLLFRKFSGNLNACCENPLGIPWKYTGKEEVARAKVMANFTEIDEARKVLGLSEAVTLKEIKRVYRTLAHRLHPDKQSGDTGEQTEEAMKRLNWAYKLLMDYCSDYKYSFREEDVARTYPHDEYLRRYYDRWFEGI